MPGKRMPVSSTRLRGAAVTLPIVGLFLLMPPVTTLFIGAATVAGIPLVVVYLFGVWLGLIVCAALLARRMARASALPEPEPPPGADAPPEPAD